MVENSVSEDQFSHNTQKLDFKFTANSRHCHSTNNSSVIVSGTPVDQKKAFLKDKQTALNK
jgi:hypothetical protein